MFSLIYLIINLLYWFENDVKTKTYLIFTVFVLALTTWIVGICCNSGHREEVSYVVPITQVETSNNGTAQVANYFHDGKSISINLNNHFSQSFDPNAKVKITKTKNYRCGILINTSKVEVLK